MSAACICGLVLSTGAGQPFGFLLAYQTGMLPFSGEDLPRPVSAYDSNLDEALEGCFDRESGKPVPRDRLKSYRDALAQSHLHPESKFHRGDYTDRGFIRGRHVRAMVTEFIGKEANRWEEQYHLGLGSEALPKCGLSPEGRERALEAVRQVADTRGQRKLAAAAGVSLSELSDVLLGKRSPNPTTLAKLCVAISHLQSAQSEEIERTRSVLEDVRLRCRLTGLRRFARRAGVDPANLNGVLKGRTKPSWLMLAKLQALLAEES